jgi:hypothetical protein
VLARGLIGCIAAMTGLLAVAAEGERPRITYPTPDTILFGTQPVCIGGVFDPRAVTVHVLGPGGAVRGFARAEAGGPCRIDFGSSLESFRIQAAVSWRDAAGLYRKGESPTVRTRPARKASARARVHEAVVSLRPGEIERARRALKGHGGERRLADPRHFRGRFADQPIRVRDARLAAQGGDGAGRRETLVLLDVSSSVPHARAARTALIEHLQDLVARSWAEQDTPVRRFAILGFDQTFVGGPDVRFVPVPQAIDEVRKLNLVRRTSGSRICRSWRHGMEQAARRRQVLASAGIEAEVDLIILSDFSDVLPENERVSIGPKHDRAACADLRSRAGSYGVAAYALPIRFGGNANFGFGDVARRSGGGVYEARTYRDALREIEGRRQLEIEFETVARDEEGRLVIESPLFARGGRLYDAERRLGEPWREGDPAELVLEIMGVHARRKDPLPPSALPRFHHALYELTSRALIHDPLEAWRSGGDMRAETRQATRYARALRDAVVPAVPEGRFLRELRALVSLAQLDQFPLPAETKQILRQIHAPEEPPCADVYH